MPATRPLNCWRLWSGVQNKRSTHQRISPSLLQCNKSDRRTKLAIPRSTITAVPREIANGMGGVCWVAPKSEKDEFVDVRFGSNADITVRLRNVRFTPKSGH